jgi:hypothetical protein
MNVVAEMLLTEPAPAAIWALLLLLTFPAVLLLGSPTGVRHPRRAVHELVAVWRERGEQRRRQVAEAVDAAQFAGEVRVAAERAAAGAQRWRELWQQSEDEVTTAWQAWLAAEDRLRTVRAAAAWGPPWSVRTCEEYAARERFLHRAVRAAAGRGELPADAVADALAGRHGWDARLHPVEQELVIARVSAAHLRQRYERAVAAERATCHDADLARRAEISLRREAGAAAARAARLAERLPVRRDDVARQAPARVAVPAT